MDDVSAHGNARAQIRAHDALAGFAWILCLLRHILASLLAPIFMLSIAMYGPGRAIRRHGS